MTQFLPRKRFATLVLFGLLLLSAACDFKDPLYDAGTVKGQKSWERFEPLLDQETAELIQTNRFKWDETVGLDTWCDYLPPYDMTRVQKSIDEMEKYLDGQEAVGNLTDQQIALYGRIRTSLTTEHARAAHVGDARVRCETAISDYLR